MADPFTLGNIAAGCVWGLITGPFGNRADATVMVSARRLAGVLAGSQTPANHDVLRATHAAWLKSVQVMAALAEGATAVWDDTRSYKALVKAVRGDALKELRFDGGDFPRAELDRLIADIYREDADPQALATEAVIARVEVVMGEPLTENLKAVFRHGHAGKRGWAATFQLLFSQAVKDNDAVFRILAFERLNEVIAQVGSNAAALNGLQTLLTDFWRAVAAQLDRIETDVTFLVAAEQERRGAQIAEARIDEAALVRIARRIAENVENPDQALAEIDARMTELLQLRQEAARGSNLDADVNATLRYIDERAAAGEFEAADREAGRAFRQWEDQEQERRARAKAEGMSYADANIRTKRFLRDAEGIAYWIARKAAIEVGADYAGYMRLEAELEPLIETGRDRGVNLDLEIAAALAAFMAEAAATREEAAAAQVWRGNALLPLGDRQEGTTALDEAVRAYRAALKVYTHEALPLQWAATQNNLGNALRILGTRKEGTATLDEAVLAYRAALEVRTRGELPLDWAMTQNNLGTALQRLGERQEGVAALDDAVQAYRAALEVRTREVLPLDWATTQNNLGTALSTLGARQEGTSALDEAVQAYRGALSVFTRDALPLDWATAQNNLGNTLRIFGDRQGSTAVLYEAVLAYRAVLEVFTREVMPLGWAMTQNNLGNALLTLGKRQESTAPLDEAVAAYRSALEVHTRDALPLDWAGTTLSLLLAQAQIHERGGDARDLVALRTEAQEARRLLVNGGHAQWAQWGDHVIAQIDRIAVLD